MTSHAEAPAASSSKPEASDPKRLGKYVLEKRLGTGGMGTVFLAVDSDLHRTVALKLLPKDRAANPTLVKRFKSEGQAAARLEHDNIVKVFEAGQIQGQLYLALEYVDGIDVLELTRKRDVLPVRRSIEIVRQVAAALQHAAEKKMVHRDIKPSNILIRKDGVVKLADMGLARVIDDTTDTNITRDGMTVGTVDYMSPEQARDSKSADIRSDLYSLGCSWYHMLTGQPPFPDGSVTSKLQAHATSPPPDPRHVNDRVPEAIVAVIQRLMAKRPIDRYQTPEELIADLSQSHLGRTGVQSDLLAGLADAHTEESASESTTGEEGAPTSPEKKRVRKRGPGEKSTGEEKSARRSAPRTARRKKREQSSREVEGEGGLPPRSANPEALGGSQRKLDPELIKFAFFGVLGLAFIGIVGWAVSRLSIFDDGGLGPGGNPFASRDLELGEEPPAATHQTVTPAAPPEDTSPAQADPVPTTEVREFDRSDPFPGTERAHFDDSIDDVPQWVYEARSQPLRGLSTFNVNSGSVSREEFARVVAALPQSGGIIEFVGRGPFPIDETEISGRSRVVFRGAGGSQPVLLLRSPMRLKGGQFEFRGVHVVAPGRDVAGSSGLIQVESGTLLLRDSSITVTDPLPEAVAAVEISGGTAAGRCVLEHTIIRGNNLTAVATSGPNVEVVIGNCLLAGGDAALVSVADPSTKEETSGESEPVAGFDILASALVTRNSGFVFSQSPGRAVPGVRLRTGDVLFVAAGDTPAPWMRLNLWPEVARGDTKNARAKGLDFSRRETRWIGWNELVRMAPPTGNEILVSDESEWVQFWRRPIDSRTLLSSPAVNLPADESRLNPAEVESAVETVFTAAGESSGLPIAVDSLPRVPESVIERIRVVSGRPRLPAEFAAGSTTNRVEFDLDKGRTLNDFLNSDACPDRSHVVLFGSGRKVIEAVRLENKTLRLEFLAREKPLFIEPIAATAGERPEALFDVEGGRIDLVGARIRIPASATRKYPLRILRVSGGDFTLQNCQLEGQLRDGATDDPLIEWNRSTGAESSSRGRALIKNSFLVGRRAVLAADAGGCLLEVRNCILLSQFDGLSLSGSEGTDEGHVVLTDCTVSVGRSAVVLEAPSNGAQITVLVDHTVFGPAVEPVDEGPIVVTLPASESGAGSLSWWENRNAFSSQFETFRSLSEETPEPQDFQEDWQRAWGPEHVLDPLTGPTAVLFESPPNSIEKAVPGDFILADSSGASRWGPGGGPVGARPAEIGPDAEAPESDETGRPKPKRPSRTMPDF